MAKIDDRLAIASEQGMKRFIVEQAKVVAQRSETPESLENHAPA